MRFIKKTIYRERVRDKYAEDIYRCYLVQLYLCAFISGGGIFWPMFFFSMIMWLQLQPIKCVLESLKNDALIDQVSSVIMVFTHYLKQKSWLDRLLCGGHCLFLLDVHTWVSVSLSSCGLRKQKFRPQLAPCCCILVQCISHRTIPYNSLWWWFLQCTRTSAFLQVTGQLV